MTGGSKVDRDEAATGAVEYRPLTPDRWKDLVRLFGPSGAWGGCWCMWWRTSAARFEEEKGGSNKAAMKEIVDSGRVPGILAYVGGEPAGWCAVAPRDEYPRLNRSWILKRVDDEPVWSIVCFYVARRRRGAGLSRGLLEAAVDYARAQGAEIVEGYPLEPREGGYPPASAWTGLVPPFLDAGFEEVARRKENRPIVRRRTVTSGDAEVA